MPAKTTIFFIQSPFHRPTLPNFADRFQMLSERCRGDIVSASEVGHDGTWFGDFKYHALPLWENGLLGSLLNFPKVVWLALKANRDRRLDYVHSCDPLAFGAAAVLIGALTGARVIVEVNGELLNSEFCTDGRLSSAAKRTAKAMLIRWSLKRAYAVKFLNSKQAADWKEFCGSGKVAVFHDFVPTHIFDPSKARDLNYILFMGFPFYIKGVDILIEAFKKIRAKHPTVKLKIVGHAPQGERERYEAMAGGDPGIEILKPVYYDEAVGLLHDCSLLVLPSRSEAMGRVLIEAMACGKPVIGANTGGIPGIVEDGGNGLLFEKGSVDSLAEKLDAILSDSTLRERMGRRSLELVESRLSSSKYAERFYELISA